MSDASRPTIVYIGGYGRSGSTLLNIVLGAQAGIMALGEVGTFWNHVLQPEAMCTCGQAFRTCPRWAPAVAAIAEGFDVPQLQRESRGIESWIRGLARARGATSRPVARTYGPAWAKVFEVLGRDGTRIFVDSSKTAYRFFWRPLALRREARADVRLIHLVRDPRDVMASCLKGQNSKLAVGDTTLRPMAATVALVGWIVANVAARVNAWRLGRGNSLIVAYEDLQSRPRETIDRLARFLGHDLDDVQERMREGRGFDAGHLAAGNRMARGQVAFPQSHVAPERSLGFWHRAGCAVFAMPLNAFLRARARREQPA